MIRFQWFPDRDDSPSFFFSGKEKQEISAAISRAEKTTSAEIRVHVEKSDPYRSVMDQAQKAFEKLGMTRTRDRNGVLIFICSEKHEFAVLGDTGIHSRVPDGFWSSVTAEMADFFRQKKFAEGVCRGIELSGEKLSLFFPRRDDDRNELSNQVSQG